MEINFNFKSQPCTSREQSERLLALGLKKETADMCWVLADEDREGNKYSVEYISIGQGKYQLLHPDWYTPAWSLYRLIEMIKKSDYLHYDDVGCIKLYLEQDDFDRVIAIISIMVKEGYFNKEYLV